MQEKSTKTIVMTGGTCGLGVVAARQIAAVPDARLLIGVRGNKPSPSMSFPLDLASLDRVRKFTQAVSDALGEAPIDVLVLNAGTQFANIDQRTVDGFETTFAVNHLAHYLLLRLLEPKLSEGAIVVLTTSDTHDPQVNPMAAPKGLELGLLAHPQPTRTPTGFMDGFRAYSASKLCNILTARVFAASDEAKARGLVVIAYNPGFTPGTSLQRAAPLWAKLGMGVARVIRLFTKINTIDLAGETLADLALGRIAPPSGRIYASLVSRKLIWPDPAALALREDLMDMLWRDSADMVGLSNCGAWR